MFIFVSIIAILIWTAFWGAIRLERTMGDTRLPDRDTAAPGQALRHGSSQIGPPSEGDEPKPTTPSQDRGLLPRARMWGPTHVDPR